MTSDLRFLEANVNYFRTILDTVQAGINIIDKNGEIVYVNHTYCIMNGYDKDELIGKSLAMILPDKDPKKGLENYKKIITSKINTPFLKESYNIKKNGTKFPVLISWNYLLDNGILEGMITVVQDMTDLKKTEEELVKSQNEITKLKNSLEHKEYLEYMMGDSGKISEVHKMVGKVAKTDFSVMIYGQTGTGKEIVAEAIHDFSNRSKNPLIRLDCGAIPESLIESELFGSVKGAFTGAIKTREGAFQKANHGTIFLDEISNLSYDMQKKLLRVLQEKEIQKIGSNRKEKLDIRIISASNENIRELVKNGKFRNDLFYRLNEFNIKIPALQDRKEDIPFLVQRFIKEICIQLKISPKTISNSALDELINYPWSGNVRELKNIIKRSIVISDNNILPEHLNLSEFDEKSTTIPHNGYLPDPNNKNDYDLKQSLKEYSKILEKEIIDNTLKYFKGNKSKTARFLKIDYKNLFYKIKEYRL